MKKKTKKKVEKTEDVQEKPQTDFSFTDKDVEREVDKLFKGEGQTVNEPETRHISEKVRFGVEVKNKLPDKGFLEVKAEKGIVKFKDKYGEVQEKQKVIITSKDIEDIEHVEITDGLFATDLRNDANWWFIRSPIIVPSMIRQAKRVAIDTRKCYEDEKRRPEIPLWLIVALICGAGIILLMLWSLFT